MTVVHCSIVLGMKILEHCKVYSFLDVNNIYAMPSFMHNYETLEFIYQKDDNKGPSVTYDIKRCIYA